MKSINLSVFWKVWILVLFFIAAIFFFLMDFSPYLHIDEFTIVELGRTIFHPSSSWSIAWSVSENLPAINIFYLGTIFQEFSFQTLGDLGPRTSGISGALISATLLVGWLLERSVSRQVAFILGIVFLLDPIFVQSYTMGRLDGWALAFSFLSCLLLRISTNRRRGDICFLIAGSSAMISIFIWPTSALMWPLILMELLLYFNRRTKYDRMKPALLLFLFGLGGILTLIFLMIPIIWSLKSSMLLIINGILLNLHSGAPANNETNFSRIIDPVLTLLRVLKFSPFLVVFAMISAVAKRNKMLLMSFLFSTCVILFSLVYLHRVIYLLPYLILFVSESFQTPYVLNTKKFSSVITVSGFLVLIIWASSISLIGRSLLALELRNENNRNLIFNAAKDMIGEGHHSVYLPGPEFYYAGRELGWEMYRPYAAHGDTLSMEMLTNILPKVDFIVMPSWEDDSTFNFYFMEEGFVDMGWYHMYDNNDRIMNESLSNIMRIRNLFFIHPKAYGPYKLYSKRIK